MLAWPISIQCGLNIPRLLILPEFGKQVIGVLISTGMCARHHGPCVVKLGTKGVVTRGSLDNDVDYQISHVNRSMSDKGDGDIIWE